MRITQPGIYTDIAAADYYADCCPEPSLTQSVAKVLLENAPAHARLEHPRLAPPAGDDDEPEKYLARTAIGNAAHAILIGRGREVAIGEYDAWTTKEARAFKAEALASGKTIILAKHYERALAMVKATRQQLDATGGHCDAFKVGHGEVVLAWQEGGLWFRCLVDWLVDTRRPYDLKTSGLCCAPHVVAERPSEQGWDIQGAMIERGLDALDPQNAGRRQIHFIAQENWPPYALTPVLLSEHDLTMGRKKLAYAVELWRACMARGQWPGYPVETVISRPRGYLETRWLEREVADEERRARGDAMLTNLAGG